MFKKPVWDELSFLTWCIILLEVFIRRWVHCVIKGWTCSGTIHSSGKLWCLNDAQLVLRSPKCAKKISPTPLHHHHQHQPEPLIQGRMDPCFHVLYVKFWPYHLNIAAEIETHQTRQRFSNLLLSNFGEPVHLVWSSAAVAHLLQGLTCYAFRDGILHTLVVTSGYLSYCSVIFNQSAHSPLTSDINKAFSSTQLLLTGYVLFFRLFSVNPRDGCAWKSQQFLKYSDQPVWHQQPFHVQSHLNPLSSHADARFELQHVVFTTYRCLNALSCSHVIGWLAICVTKQLNRCT